MTTLTLQEIAEVAREVMDDGRAIIHKNLVYLHGNILWTPRFDHCHQCRSQALAVVEWLCARLWADYTNGLFSDNLDCNRRLYHAATACVAEHAYHKNTAALMRMVLELKRGR